MYQLSNQQLESAIEYDTLTKVLEKAFAGNYTTPLRHHHNFDNPIAKKFSTFLLMPSWDNQQYLGVKLVTVSPENSKHKLPTIQGLYILFDIKNGNPLMQCDARLLTVKRTAAASALASQFLSRKDSNILLMIGTGYLAPHLIEAHAAVRPIEKVLIWGRNYSNAKKVADQFDQSGFEAEAIDNLEEGVKRADIISAATMSKEPLIRGDWLKPGQHIDLVGSYLPTHREADDEVIKRSRIFLDNMEGAMKESGDIAIPLANGVLKKEAIVADLFSMCKSDKDSFRKNEAEITLFKSVGHALEDLATASYVYERVLSY